MITEIRDYGDKKTIVVYTKDNSVLRKFRKWKACQKVVFYEVWENCDPRNAVKVAVDLYFNKTEENRIREALNMPSKEKKRSEAQKKQTARLTEAGRQNRFSSRKTKDAKKVVTLAVKNLPKTDF